MAKISHGERASTSMVTLASGRAGGTTALSAT
jgi:hypothetical protein